MLVKPVKQRTARPGKPAPRGFTLVEMIVTIVVSAIIAVGIVDFIGRSVTGLDTTAGRNQLASAGRTAIDRLAMELHNALPNSIRATPAQPGGDQCIEFIPIRAMTSYIDAPVTGPGAATFDVVDFVPSEHGASSAFAVIYPNDIDELYDGDNGASGNWPDFPDRGPIQEISSIADSSDPDQSTVTLVKSHRFQRRSHCHVDCQSPPADHQMALSNLLAAVLSHSVQVFEAEFRRLLFDENRSVVSATQQVQQPLDFQFAIGAYQKLFSVTTGRRNGFVPEDRSAIRSFQEFLVVRQEIVGEIIETGQRL